MNNKVSLTVKAEAGLYTESYNVNQNIQHIIKKTLHHFGIDQDEYPKYELRLDDTILNLSATIEKLGLNATSNLYLLLKEPPVDGGQAYA